MSKQISERKSKEFAIIDKSSETTDLIRVNPRPERNKIENETPIKFNVKKHVPLESMYYQHVDDDINIRRSRN